MTSRTPAWPSTRASTSSRRTSCARCSSASAPTARSARTRTRRRSWPRIPNRHAQGYFVYDSKKSGSYTISHLRFGPRPIRAPYLLKSANFVGIHKFDFLYKLDTLAAAAPGATVLINSPYGPDDGLGRDPAGGAAADHRQAAASSTSSTRPGWRRASASGSRVNTILQTCFFALSGVMPRDKAIEAIKRATEKTYARKGKAIVEKNFAAIDSALANLHEVRVPAKAAGQRIRLTLVPDSAPEFVRNVTAPILAMRGDTLPVSALPGGRDVSDRHDAIREAEHRRRGAGLGIRPLHPVRPVRDRLSAQRDSGQVLRREPPRRRAGGLQGRADQRARLSRVALHAAGLRRGLHRMRRVRGELPGAQPDRRRRQGDQHEGSARASRGRPREHPLLRDAALGRSHAGEFRQRARRAVPASRCSSSRAPAPGAARRRISS